MQALSRSPIIRAGQTSERECRVWSASARPRMDDISGIAGCGLWSASARQSCSRVSRRPERESLSVPAEGVASPPGFERGNQVQRIGRVAHAVRQAKGQASERGCGMCAHPYPIVAKSQRERLPVSERRCKPLSNNAMKGMRSRS